MTDKQLVVLMYLSAKSKPVFLKTGVDSIDVMNVVLNKDYREFAEHYDTAVITARVRAPKDKTMVEGTVGVMSTFILAAIRNMQFLSLQELNSTIFERLEIFNHKLFQKKDGSRAVMFEDERAFLLPLTVKSI